MAGRAPTAGTEGTTGGGGPTRTPGCSEGGGGVHVAAAAPPSNPGLVPEGGARPGTPPRKPTEPLKKWDSGRWGGVPGPPSIPGWGLTAWLRREV